MKYKILFPVISLIISFVVLLIVSLGLNGIAQRKYQEKHLQIMQILYIFKQKKIAHFVQPIYQIKHSL